VSVRTESSSESSRLNYNYHSQSNKTSPQNSGRILSASTSADSPASPLSRKNSLSQLPASNALSTNMEQTHSNNGTIDPVLLRQTSNVNLSPLKSPTGRSTSNKTDFRNGFVKSVSSLSVAALASTKSYQDHISDLGSLPVFQQRELSGSPKQYTQNLHSPKYIQAPHPQASTQGPITSAIPLLLPQQANFPLVKSQSLLTTPSKKTLGPLPVNNLPSIPPPLPSISPKKPVFDIPLNTSPKKRVDPLSRSYLSTNTIPKSLLEDNEPTDQPREFDPLKSIYHEQKNYGSSKVNIRASTTARSFKGDVSY
jgi:hypothetical protein